MCRNEEGDVMSASTRFGFGLLGAAILLGILFDALLQGTPWGLNVTALTVADRKSVV